MKVIPATKKHAKEISTRMLDDLKHPNKRFPEEMINQFREHAKEENIIKEFDNSKIIAYLCLENEGVIGFIVGYKEGSTSAVIHYINGANKEIKKVLLEEFIDSCRKRKMNIIKADSFEFMENNEIFKEEGFVFTKKEKIAENLEMLWYDFHIEA
tara:strand:- start:9393 stop:9857 length:465 start_codon:yes stop_codon:yes gene_type:complete